MGSSSISSKVTVKLTEFLSCTLLWVISRYCGHLREAGDVVIFIDCQCKMATLHARRESPKTHKMFAYPTSSPSKNSCVPVELPKICILHPLPSTTFPIPCLILPPVSSDFEHSPHNHNTVRLQNFPTSPLPRSPNTGELLPFTRSIFLLSEPSGIPKMHHSVHTLRQN